MVTGSMKHWLSDGMIFLLIESYIPAGNLHEQEATLAENEGFMCITLEGKREKPVSSDSCHAMVAIFL
jgi:hypothetical protein